MKLTSKWFFAGILVLNLVCPAVTPAHGAERLPGAPLLGIDVNEAEGGDFNAAFTAAISAGMQTTSLPVFWDEYETAPGVFQPETNWLAIANAFYSNANLPIAVGISVLDTTTRRLPADLMGRSFDDPVLIARFKNFLDYVFAQIPDLTLTYFGIGNEVDGVLGADPEKWSEYETFFTAAADYVRSLRAGTRVGVKIMLNGLTGSAKQFALSINAHSDIILLTYYPIDGGFRVLDPAVVNDAFDEVTGLYPGRPIYFAEIGYQSGTTCGSSQVLQATFVREVFKAWRKHRAQVDLVNFTWLNRGH